LDSIPQALSRYAWLVKSSPTQAALAAHNMGVFYHQAEVPEMALRFYQDAATWGNPQSQLLGGIVLAQIGNQDSAYKYFTRVRAFSSTWQDQVRKEIALLLLANGQELYASLEWNFDDAQYSDWMRGAQYAAAAGNKAWLIEMLRKAIEVDSSAWQPYDYLGRWYLDKQDPEALQTYLDGLENIPNNPWLQAGYQIACLRLTKAECQPIIPVSDTLGQLGRLFQVEKCIQAKKTSEADSLLRDWIAEHPLDTRALYRLGDLWQETGANPDNASEYFFNSISCNDQNPRLWLYYAAFSSAAGLKEQAGYGAIQASQLTREIDQQNNILNTFTEEVKIWRDAGL
jgi:tetratricopeptide (TPR) repeat protein